MIRASDVERTHGSDRGNPGPARPRTEMGARVVALAIACFLLDLSGRGAAAGEGESGFFDAHRDFLELFDPDPSIVRLGYVFQPSNETTDGADRFDLHVPSIQAWVPLAVSRDLVLMPGLRYEARAHRFAPRTRERLGGAGSETLHAIVADVSAGYFLTPEVLLLGEATGGVYSDLDQELVSDDVLFFGSALVVYRWGENIEFLAGAAVSEDLKDLEILPLGGLRWRMMDRKLFLSATLPIEVRAEYSFLPELQAYAGGWLGGDQYHGRLDDVEFRAQIRDQRAGVGLRVRPIEAIQLGIEAGASLGGQFEFELEDSEEVDYNLENTWYLSTRLGLSL